MLVHDLRLVDIVQLKHEDVDSLNYEILFNEDALLEFDVVGYCSLLEERVTVPKMKHVLDKIGD